MKRAVFLHLSAHVPPLVTKLRMQFFYVYWNFSCDFSLEEYHGWRIEFNASLIFVYFFLLRNRIKKVRCRVCRVFPGGVNAPRAARLRRKVAWLWPSRPRKFKRQQQLAIQLCPSLPTSETNFRDKLCNETFDCLWDELIRELPITLHHN